MVRLSQYIRKTDLPNVIVAVVSTLLGFVGLFGGLGKWDISRSDSLVLVILGFLATSFYFERSERTAHEHRMLAMAAGPQERPCLTTLSNLPQLDSWRGRLDELWVSGATLTGFFELFTGSVRQLLEDGASVRLLLVPPDGEMAERHVAFYSDDGEALRRHTNQVRASVDRIRELKKHHAKLQARYLSVLPAHHVTIINPESSGEVRVHLNIYQLESDAAPVIRFSKYDAQDRYGIFVTEYKEFWDHGTEIS
jgi:hypothetical protein